MQNEDTKRSQGGDRAGHLNRRTFLQGLGAGAVVLGMGGTIAKAQRVNEPIPGFEEMKDDDAYKGWEPVSDRKVRVGIVGCGLSKFGASFGFQEHPNVEVVAVSDLFPDRCAELARRTRCNKTYPSLEEMVKDKDIEAIYVATDAPSHARHCIEVLNHGKHVVTAVPAVYNGSLEEAEKLIETVKRTGLKYMMFETSCFRQDLYAMWKIYQAGGFGKIVYSEGEYYHYAEKPYSSYKGWRVGSPPMWYPTHSTAYHIAVTGGSFTSVSCLGRISDNHFHQPANNPYQNPFATEVALFRTNDGGMSRMTVSKDTAGFGAETGRVRGQRGSFYGQYRAAGQYQGLEKSLPSTRRPPLPPGVPLGGHGGSHGYLMNEFVMSIVQDRKPWIDVAMALNMTVPGIIAHQSALKDGEILKVPQFRL